MSDSFALCCALFTMLWFFDYLESNKKQWLFLHILFFIFTLMTRPMYALLLIPFALHLAVTKPFQYKKRIPLLIAWLGMIIVAVIIYAVLHGNDWRVLLDQYGSVIPTIGDIVLTIGIVLKSVGPAMVVAFFVGLVYLLIKRPPHLIFLLSLIIVFTLYVSSWYHNGSFDIERYSLLITALLLLIAGYCFQWGLPGKILYGSTLLCSFVMVGIGLLHPAATYNAYAFSHTSMDDYIVKASQISQQKEPDIELQTEIDLSDVVTSSDVIFHWGNDWSKSQLVLQGDQLPKRASLVSIDSDQELSIALKEYAAHRIYLLRGVYASYVAITGQQPQRRVLKGRSVVYFVEPQAQP